MCKSIHRLMPAIVDADADDDVDDDLVYLIYGRR